MASSIIKKQFNTKTMSITSNTGAAGNARMTGIQNNDVVISAQTDTDRGYVLIPFKSSGSWFVKCLTWDTWERVLSTDITFTVNYY